VSIALWLYLALFAAGGAWSAWSDRAITAAVEVAAEAVAILVLSAGMLFFLLGISSPGGNHLWLFPVALACASELLVVYLDRARTVRGARAAGEQNLEAKIRFTDVAAILLFVPAIGVNMSYALSHS
jgi:hypothetical protein